MYLLLLLIFLSTCLIYSTSKEYNRSILMEKYPELGQNFVIFPKEEEESPKVGYLNVMPASKRFFGFGSKVEEAVTFTLYNRCAPDGIQLKDYQDLPPDFDKTEKTIFVTHGWMSSGKKNACVKIKDAYLNTSDVNVFIVDWGRIADNVFYMVPMGRVDEIGAFYSKFLNSLVNNHKLNPKDFHLIGHSLGAHISGAAGRRVTKGKVGRVTGLDPAHPGFHAENLTLGRLSKNDAQFVDVIHTCSGLLGLEEPLGHADFYPNTGQPPQPGCSFLDIVEVCSHGRSWELYVYTVLLTQHFVGHKCESMDKLHKSECSGPKAPMGAPTPKTARGIFYVETTGYEPFIKT